MGQGGGKRAQQGSGGFDGDAVYGGGDAARVGGGQALWGQREVRLDCGREVEDVAGAGEGDGGDASSGIRGAVVVEDEYAADAVYAVAGGFSGGHDCGEGDLVLDSGAGAGGATDNSFVSVWQPEREQEPV